MKIVVSVLGLAFLIVSCGQNAGVAEKTNITVASSPRLPPFPEVKKPVLELEEEDTNSDPEPETEPSFAEVKAAVEDLRFRNIDYLYPSIETILKMGKKTIPHLIKIGQEKRDLSQIPTLRDIPNYAIEVLGYFKASDERDNFLLNILENDSDVHKKASAALSLRGYDTKTLSESVRAAHKQFKLRTLKGTKANKKVLPDLKKISSKLNEQLKTTAKDDLFLLNFAIGQIEILIKELEQ